MKFLHRIYKFTSTYLIFVELIRISYVEEFENNSVKGILFKGTDFIQSINLYYSYTFFIIKTNISCLITVYRPLIFLYIMVLYTQKSPLGFYSYVDPQSLFDFLPE